MRRIGKVGSVILIAIGLLWALQGAGYVGGSFMTGASAWLYIGIVTAVVGLIGLVMSVRKPS